MAAPEITGSGVSIQTYEEVFDELATDLLTVYPGAALEADTPDGQRVGIEAKARQDMQQFALAVYNAQDPDLASGLDLQRIAKLAGLYPRPATRGSWDITVTVSANITLPVDYAILDTDTNERWILQSPASCTTGANTVTFVADRFGAVGGASSADLQQATVNLGVTALAAPGNATPGAEGETDQEFRLRRLRSVDNPAYSTAGSLLARVANLPGVTDAVVYENTGDVADARTVPAHGLWLIVEAGETQDIAEAMVLQKTAGTATKGTAYTYTETITRPDGSTFVITHGVRFDRPTDVPLAVRLTVAARLPGDTWDAAAIKAAIADYAFRIGQDLQAGQLYAEAYGGGDTFIVTDLEISDDAGGNWTDGRLFPGYDGKFSLIVGDILVNGA